MRLVCAMLVSEWHFEWANVFALFRERRFQKDTIPKPGGLGSGELHRGSAVQCLSGICPVSVRVLSGAPWKNNFNAF
jgi:hypothetical protein